MESNNEATGIGRITATLESTLEPTLEERVAEAEARLVATEARLAELQAAAATETVPAAVTNGRKTLPAGMAALLAKQGVAIDSGAGINTIEAGALDAALSSLSIEQRIAVKAQLLRAGVLG